MALPTSQNQCFSSIEPGSEARRVTKTKLCDKSHICFKTCIDMISDQRDTRVLLATKSFSSKSLRFCRSFPEGALSFRYALAGASPQHIFASDNTCLIVLASVEQRSILLFRREINFSVTPTRQHYSITRLRERVVSVSS